jgi:pimeloyl-ACP methyl ester carboxylesterase
MPSGLHVVRAGAGPHILLIHGSATDHRTWSIQLASPLRTQFTLIAYDRRGDAPSVEAHAEDAAALLAAEPGRGIVIGSSFGAVIALDLVRRHPQRVAGAILIEPPLAASDTVPAVAASFLSAFDARAARDGGPAAGELFLRTVLGDAVFERMPRALQVDATSRFAEIRADSAALMAYLPRYAALAAIATPILLLGGERSAPLYGPTLEALHRALGNAQLETVPGAGHMLHAEASRKFHALVTAFAGRVLGELAPP